MAELELRSGNARIDLLVPRIRMFLEKDVMSYNMFGRAVRGYRSPDSPSIWLRDHSDMLRAGKYWERDLQSAISHFAETQTSQGWLYDFFSMVPEKKPCEKENWAKYVRVPVEADVEYRLIKGTYIAWQATGDDRWLKEMLPVMEKALHYVMTDPWRWDRKHHLVKRAYTIDTWDFDYTKGEHDWLNFQITDKTFWGIMHGDNSGYYEAFILMSRFYDHLRNSRRSAYWRKAARDLRRRTNRLCFNGRFYTHRVPLTPVKIEGVDEAEQLSLSNAMDINRGLATHTMAARIIREYQERGKHSGVFAEWFSIDPPFPDGIFGDAKIVRGAYCNGGIMPLVGGELSRAAFEHGFEPYGVEQLLKYEKLTANNESYLWYFPNGQHATEETSTSPEAIPSDGWGSSAMLYALIEGLAGVVDTDRLFRRVRLSPRWESARSEGAEVSVAYGPSGASFAYSYAHDKGKKVIELELRGKSFVELHLLLPPGLKARSLRYNGRSIPFSHARVEGSFYLDAQMELKKKGKVVVAYE
jgi:hypothetical protein